MTEAQLEHWLILMVGPTRRTCPHCKQQYRFDIHTGTVVGGGPGRQKLCEHCSYVFKALYRLQPHWRRLQALRES